MPITMSGMASGVDTDAIIEKLINVESEPIRQLEIRKKNHSIKKEALNRLSGYLEDINSAAKDLFGFRASYDDKKAISSNPSILEAKANKNAPKGMRKIQVLQIASSHKISTDPVKGSEDLEPGKFTLEVDGESRLIKFKGGKLKALQDRIEEVASDIVSTSYIKTSGDNYILSLESKVLGKKGEIKIGGDMNFLKKVGMVSGVKGDKMSEIALTFDNKYFSQYSGDRQVDRQTGAIAISGDGKKITLKGLLWREYELPVPLAVKENTLLEFDFAYRGPDEDERDENIPGRVEIGPEEKINVKGIELKGYNISRLREDKKEEKKEYDSVLGVGIVSVEDGRRTEKIYPLEKDSKGRQEIPVGRDFEKKTVKKVIVYCNVGDTDFSNARFTTPEKEKGLLEPKNRIAEARDAKLKVDGVEITRDKNEGLNDIIKGVDINLKVPSQEVVDINIEHNIENAVERIKKFIEAYNKYLDYHRELIKTSKANKPGDYARREYNPGLFVGDTTITRLESMLRTVVNAAYPNRADKQIKLLTQMGISTGEINASWESIKSGKLVVDESLLERTIRENPEGISMFFGSDTDGDNRPDTGMAYMVVYNLRPYVSSGKNIIATKIDLEDNSIKMADERIQRHEEHLKKYEENLRRKFSSMERAITESKSQRNWMDQQFGLEKKKDK